MGTEMAFRFKGLYMFSASASVEWECVDQFSDVLVFTGVMCIPVICNRFWI